MAYWPVKARSEFVMPTNFADGCVRESTRKFQVASCASMSPACRPTRGSGFGAVADVLERAPASVARGDTPFSDIEDVECEHAAVKSRATARDSAGRRTAVAHTSCRRVRKTDAIAKSSRGAGWSKRLGDVRVTTARFSGARTS